MASDAAPPPPPTGPGLFFVNSKISKPDELSPEVFTKWYEEVHIPDIFKASTEGIDSGFRYYTTDASPVDRPYLALYPLRDVKFLSTPEFFGLPAHSDLLPGPSHFIFDVANFATRFYLRGDVTQSEENAASGKPVAGSDPEDDIDAYRSCGLHCGCRH